METSYGNAGLYSPSDSYAWASPDALKIALRSLVNHDLGIQYRLRIDPKLWLWSLKFLANCTDTAARRNSLRKLRLTVYSLERLKSVIQETGVAFGNRREGIIYYFESPDATTAADRHMGLLRDNGLDLRLLDRDGVLDVEPGLESIAGRIAGALYAPGCQTGSSHMFANGLAEWCARHRGTEFRFGETVERLRRDGDRIAGVETDRGRVTANAYVLAAGPHSAGLGRDAGLKLPIYPVKGFSITADVDPAVGPTMGVVDEDRLSSHLRGPPPRAHRRSDAPACSRAGRRVRSPRRASRGRSRYGSRGKKWTGRCWPVAANSAAKASMGVTPTPLDKSTTGRSDRASTKSPRGA